MFLPTWIIWCYCKRALNPLVAAVEHHEDTQFFYLPLPKIQNQAHSFSLALPFFPFSYNSFPWGKRIEMGEAILLSSDSMCMVFVCCVTGHNNGVIVHVLINSAQQATHYPFPGIDLNYSNKTKAENYLQQSRTEKIVICAFILEDKAAGCSAIPAAGFLLC